MNEYLSQTEQIRNHLLTGSELTGLEAFIMFKTLNLSQRIYDLRKSGFPVQDKWLKVSNKKKVKVYYYEK